MTNLVVFLFAFTYIGMALGRVPGLRIDRADIAMIVAVVLVVAGAMAVKPLKGSTQAAIVLTVEAALVVCRQTNQPHSQSRAILRSPLPRRTRGACR
jgi:hypothetical protein